MIITVNNALLILCLFYFAVSAFIFYLFRKVNLFFKVIVFCFILSIILTVADVNRIEVTLSVVFGFFVIYRESIIELFLDCKYWLENLFDFVKGIVVGIGKIFLWFFGIFKLFKSSQQTSTTANNSGQQQGTSHNQTNNNQQSQEQEERVRQAKEELRRMREEQEAKDNRSHQDILGLNGNFTLSELKEAYRLAVSRYHPDKYSHMSESFQKEAEQELVKVQQAYRELILNFS